MSASSSTVRPGRYQVDELVEAQDRLHRGAPFRQRRARREEVELQPVTLGENVRLGRNRRLEERLSIRVVRAHRHGVDRTATTAPLI
jgi:hypothetical protein